MSREPDETLDVLRGVWSARGQGVADLDEAAGAGKSCKRMANVGFGDMAEDDADLRAAWRERLQREGKLNPEGAASPTSSWGQRSAANQMPGTEQPAGAPGAPGHPESVGQLTDLLREGGYLADRGLATALFVAMSLQRPILLEGEVGVGKTEVAKVLASVFGRKLIRLQCYEGIDTSQALYEWDYTRQMLQIRALSEHQVMGEEAVDKLFGPKFLLERPLLEAVRSGDRSVLLIDEVDRADDEFEAFLLEVLSDFQISIPEIGTIKAGSAPLVVLTSNRTRELHDALKRRCLYHWIGYPPAEREVQIVLIREPGVSEALARNVVAAVNRLRQLDLAKPPGVAETIDWARTVDLLGGTELDPQLAQDTLGAVVKERDDLDVVQDNLEEITSGA